MAAGAAPAAGAFVWAGALETKPARASAAKARTDRCVMETSGKWCRRILPPTHGAPDGSPHSLHRVGEVAAASSGRHALTVPIDSIQAAAAGSGRHASLAPLPQLLSTHAGHCPQPERWPAGRLHDAVPVAG